MSMPQFAAPPAYSQVTAAGNHLFALDAQSGLWWSDIFEIAWSPITYGGTGKPASITCAVFPGPSGANTLFVLSSDGTLWGYVIYANQWTQFQAGTPGPPATAIPEAPTDGKMYLRQSSAWTPDPVTEAPTDAKMYVRQSATWIADPVTEAPTDGQTYGRQSSAWSVISPLTWGTLTLDPAWTGTIRLRKGPFNQTLQLNGNATLATGSLSNNTFKLLATLPSGSWPAYQSTISVPFYTTSAQWTNGIVQVNTNGTMNVLVSSSGANQVFMDRVITLT